MKTKQLKALKACSKALKGYESLRGKVFYQEGLLFATDSYIMISVSTPETDALCDSVDGKRVVTGFEDFAPGYEYRISDHLESTDLPGNSLKPETVRNLLRPDLSNGFAFPDLSRETSVAVDPARLKKVLAVFTAFGKVPHLRDLGECRLQLYSCDKDAEIWAIAMGVRQ